MEPDAVDQMVGRWTAERPDLEVSSMSVLSRISLAHHLFRRLVERQYAKLGLNSASFDVLAMLRQVGESYRLTPTQLYTATRERSTDRGTGLPGARPAHADPGTGESRGRRYPGRGGQ